MRKWREKRNAGKLNIITIILGSTLLLSSISSQEFIVDRIVIASSDNLALLKSNDNQNKPNTPPVLSSLAWEGHLKQ